MSSAFHYAVVRTADGYCYSLSYHSDAAHEIARALSLMHAGVTFHVRDDVSFPAVVYGYWTSGERHATKR